MSKRPIHDIVKKMNSCGSLTDREVLLGIEHFAKLANMLNISGDEYRHAFRDAATRRNQLESWAQARGLDFPKNEAG